MTGAINPYSKFNVQMSPVSNNVRNSAPPSTAPIKLPDQPKADGLVKQETAPSSDKTKKIIKYAAIIAALALSAVVGVKVLKTGKLKKEILAQYDKLCEEAAKTAQDAGINFEKPKLLFKSQEGLHAAYLPNTNEIIFNKKMLNKNKFSLYQDTCGIWDVTSNDKTKTIQLADIFANAKKEEGRRALTDNEHMLNIKEVLVHELTHARQTQLALSADGAIDKIVEIYKNKPEFKGKTVAEVRKSLEKTHPFIFSYKPKKIFSDSQQFKIITPRGDSLLYKPESMLNAIFNYPDASSDKYGYYCNVAEIEARIAEAKFAQRALDDPNIGISEEVLKANLLAKNFTSHNVLKAVMGK